jgi:hypothetical protein
MAPEKDMRRHEPAFLVMPTKACPGLGSGIGIHDFGRPSPIKGRFLVSRPSAPPTHRTPNYQPVMPTKVGIHDFRASQSYQGPLSYKASFSDLGSSHPKLALLPTRLVLTICVLVATNALLIPCGQAYTPWGLLASRVIGHVKQLSQKPKQDQPGFDVATVILNANATRVYTTAVSLLRRNQTVHIVAEDPRGRTVEFSDGTRSASITVSDLGTRLSQILVASATKPGENPATPRIAQGILNVCHAMKVTCSAQ